MSEYTDPLQSPEVQPTAQAGGRLVFVLRSGRLRSCESARECVCVCNDWRLIAAHACNVHALTCVVQLRCRVIETHARGSAYAGVYALLGRQQLPCLQRRCTFWRALILSQSDAASTGSHPSKLDDHTHTLTDSNRRHPSALPSTIICTRYCDCRSCTLHISGRGTDGDEAPVSVTPGSRHE